MLRLTFWVHVLMPHKYWNSSWENEILEYISYSKISHFCFITFITLACLHLDKAAVFDKITEKLLFVQRFYNRNQHQKLVFRQTKLNQVVDSENHCIYTQTVHMCSQSKYIPVHYTHMYTKKQCYTLCRRLTRGSVMAKIILTCKLSDHSLQRSPNI